MKTRVDSASTASATFYPVLAQTSVDRLRRKDKTGRLELDVLEQEYEWAVIHGRRPDEGSKGLVPEHRGEHRPGLMAYCVALWREMARPAQFDPWDYEALRDALVVQAPHWLCLDARIDVPYINGDTQTVSEALCRVEVLLAQAVLFDQFLIDRKARPPTELASLMVLLDDHHPGWRAQLTQRWGAPTRRALLAASDGHYNWWRPRQVGSALCATVAPLMAMGPQNAAQLIYRTVRYGIEMDEMSWRGIAMKVCAAGASEDDEVLHVETALANWPYMRLGDFIDGELRLSVGTESRAAYWRHMLLAHGLSRALDPAGSPTPRL